jgi:hypothetical protein
MGIPTAICGPPVAVLFASYRIVAYGAAYFLGKCGQRLTSGSATAFKGTIIGVE